MYLLCSGRVKIARVSDQGREITLYVVEPCQIFGEESLSQQEIPYGVTAETLEDCMICAFRRSDFLEAFRPAHDAMLGLLHLVNDRRVQAEGKIADLVFLDVPRRLAKLLLVFHDNDGRRSDGLIQTKYTHQDLANLIGSTRETTTLILNEFRRLGVIGFLGRRIVIRHREELEALLQRDKNSSATR